MDPIDRQILSEIAREIGLSSDEIARRKEFLEFTEADIGRLSDIHGHMTDVHLEDIFSELFYTHLTAFPDLREFIPDEAAIARLKRIQARYFMRLTAGDYGESYVMERLGVGLTHQRIGLEPRWYTGAYRKYLSFLLSSVYAHIGHDESRFLATYDALLKVVFFDMELALDTYFHGDRQKLLHMANHDALTGLPNRTLLGDRIERALLQAHRDGNQVALLFIDLDRFKNINDALGHPVGDAVITEAARRLVAALREEDTVARLGGDEFVAVLSGMEREETIAVVANKLLKSLEAPIAVGSHEFYISASIGIAVYPGDGDTQDVLMKHADLALYRAKQEGRNAFRFYQRGMNEMLLTRLNLETRVRRALEKGELILHYQPQIDLTSGQIVAVEGLLRWASEGMFIPPLAFIPLIEETGLILPIGEWVMETACRQAAAWHECGISGLKVAVNLSMRQLWNKDFFDTVWRILAQTGCRPEWLELEITESILMDNPTEAVSVLRKLADLGVTIAIDDFGTGYSSLAYLKRFPVQSLKVDRTFVQNVSCDADDAAIVRAVIALAHSLDLKVVGEGIEDATQLAFLAGLGCNLGQGYYFSTPLPADDITPMLLNSTAMAPGFDIRNCLVRWIGEHVAKCMVDKSACPFARVPGDLCEHPLVDRISAV
jgi:diguanylate cyclase (GGDEF)-like protein